MRQSALPANQPRGFLNTPPAGGIQPESARSGTWPMIGGMPELSRFFGIIIRMFSEAGMSHRVAHFHAYFQDEAAVF